MFDIRIPLELAEMELIKVIESPTIEGFGILFLGENFEQEEENAPTVRVYLLKRISGILEIEKELQTFSFFDVKKALMFVELFPQMSAIELLIDMNIVDSVKNYH